MKCVQREQRRASRRKSGLSDNLLWCDNPRRSAILFNDKQLLKLDKSSTNNNSDEISLTTRIVCYCRHHKANEGFKILFIVTDPASNNKIVAKKITSPIIITDRKPNSINTINNNKTDLDLLTESVPTLSNFTGSTSRNSSNNITTSSMTSNVQKKYIPSPNSLSETGGSESFTSEYVSATYQDYSSSATTADFLPRQDSINFNNMTFSTNNNNNNTLNPRKRSHLNITSSISSNPSFINDFNQPFDSTQYYTQHQQQSQQPDPNQPILQRVIPAKGPTSGGIEVTLLGSNFKDGLKVKFGNNLALSTQCWNDSTMVTYLPPTQSPGQVIVTIQDPDDDMIMETDTSMLQHLNNNNNSSLQNSIFTYTDETDRQLIELALQIVGLKMNGKLDDARNIAKKIVGSGDNTNDDPSPGTSSTNNDITNQYNYNTELNDENLIIKVIKSMNKTTTHLSMCDTIGRTLLHLAALSGYYNLSLLLIKSGVHLDIEDSFGFTPLHFAAIGGDYNVINLLINFKAHIDLTNNNKHSTPRQVFINNFNETTNDSYSKIISLFDKYEEKISNNDKLSRISSHSSIDSSIFNEEMNENAKMIGTKHFQNNEIENENKNDDDVISYISDCDFEDNVSFSENDSDNNDDKSHNDSASIVTTPQIPKLETTTNNTSDDDDSTKRQSLWGRMLNHLNDDLPSYDDLFPKLNGKTNDDLKVIETTNVTTTQDNESSQDTHIGSSTSEDDEDDLIQVKLNKFFIKQKKTFQNDNMLLFFWIPLTLLLLTFVMFNSFYQGNDSSIINKSTDMIKGYIMVGLGKIWLGNQRMKNYVTENLNNFPTTKKLNDLIVG